jgi:bifunctional non-homologous end joining protein LigD
VAGIALSHPDRVLYPRQGITKQALAKYYARIEELILPHLAGRPVMIVRCPRGREQECFFQKHVTESLPATVHGVSIREKAEERRYIVIKDLAGLVSLVQFGSLEFHPWNCRADQVEKPDRLIFDLDPGEGTVWKQVVKAAHDVQALLTQLDLQCFVRTSGGKGLHVVAPLVRHSGWNGLQEFAGMVARALVQRFPEHYVASMSKSKRRGKVFIDYFRNTRGATAICSYSTRARQDAPVALPIRWDEISSLKSADAYTVNNLPRRLAGLKEDPWKGFFSVRQSLSQKRLRTLARILQEE